MRPHIPQALAQMTAICNVIAAISDLRLLAKERRARHKDIRQCWACNGITSRFIDGSLLEGDISASEKSSA